MADQGGYYGDMSSATISAGPTIVSNAGNQSFTRYENYASAGGTAGGANFSDDVTYSNFGQSAASADSTATAAAAPVSLITGAKSFSKRKFGGQGGKFGGGGGGTGRYGFQPMQRGYQGVSGGMDNSQYDGGSYGTGYGGYGAGGYNYGYGNYYDQSGQASAYYGYQGYYPNATAAAGGGGGRYDESGYDWSTGQQAAVQSGGGYGGVGDHQQGQLDTQLKAFAGYGGGAAGDVMVNAELTGESEYMPLGGPGRYPAAPGDFGQFQGPMAGRPGMKNDLFSLTFGIEELAPVEDDEEEEEQEETMKKPKLDAAMGEWETTGDQVDSLTRDARKIAGNVEKMEETPQDEEFVQRASEIEITVPADMMQPDYCKLCEARFTCAESAKAHYTGKNHNKKENQYVRKIYDEMGINVTRFLSKPKTKPGVPQMSKKKKINRKKFRFTCFLCKVSFENETQVQMHVYNNTHRKRVFDYQTQLLSRHGPSGAGPQAMQWKANQAGKAKKGPKGQAGDFYCYICDKIMNSVEQYELHVQSKKHLKKEEETQATSGYYQNNSYQGGYDGY